MVPGPDFANARPSPYLKQVGPRRSHGGQASGARRLVASHPLAVSGAHGESDSSRLSTPSHGFRLGVLPQLSRLHLRHHPPTAARQMGPDPWGARVKASPTRLDGDFDRTRESGDAADRTPGPSLGCAAGPDHGPRHLSPSPAVPVQAQRPAPPRPAGPAPAPQGHRSSGDSRAPTPRPLGSNAHRRGPHRRTHRDTRGGLGEGRGREPGGGARP